MTLSTSDTKRNSAQAAKTAYIYLLISLFCVLFGAVYEYFGHGVYSYFMLYAFAFPLVGGTLPFATLSLIRLPLYPSTVPLSLHHLGIGTLTVGSIIKGVLDIYGTSSSLTLFYPFAGGALVLAGLVLWGISCVRQKTGKKE